MSALRRVAALAADDSRLWRDALIEGAPPDSGFAGRFAGDLLVGVEAIREGYLLHYGEARLFSQDDADLALLAGDHLYAAGLVEICRAGDLEAVSALAELISRCAANAASGRGGDDDALWERTVASLRPA